MKYLVCCVPTLARLTAYAQVVEAFHRPARFCRAGPEQRRQ